MAGLYEIEVEPEVRMWLEALSSRDFGRVDFLVGLLSDQAETLGEPYSRHLAGKVRELRFSLLRQQARVTYWLAPGRRIVLLTVFAKSRQRETAEVDRALRAQRVCEQRHSPHIRHTNERWSEMSTGHGSYEEIAGKQRETEEYREGYAEARRAFVIGGAVRERRVELGLSQTELAARAGMTQPALSRLEAGGTMPTIPVLERISAALNADLVVTISPHAA